MPQIKPEIDDFGAVDDEDLGAVDESDDFGAVEEDPLLNPFELNIRLEEEQKKQSAAAALSQQQKAAQQAADPQNWTLDQTKKHFKDNPPKTLQEEGFVQSMIEQKKQKVDEVKASILGEESPVPEPKHPETLFSKMGNKINKVLGDMGVIESPEFKAAKTQHVNAMAQKFGLDPKEVYKNYEAYLFNPEISGVQTNFFERLLMQTSMPGEGGGPMRNTEAVINRLMTPAVVAGLMTAPGPTVAALGVFTGLHSYDEWTGIGQELEESTLTPEAKAGFRLLRLLAEGGATGKISSHALGGLVEKFPFLKSYPALVGKEPAVLKPEAVKTKAEPLTVDATKDLKPAEFAETPIPKLTPETKKFQATVFSELEKVNKDRTLTPEEQLAQDWVIKNPEQARQNYIDRSVDEFKSDNVLSADIGKFAVNDPATGLKMTAERSADFHESGSAMTKAREKELLADKSTVDLPTAFTAGGSGSGKSFLLRSEASNKGSSLKEEYGLVYDTNLNNYKNSIEKIEKNLNDGRPVDITYVYRDPVEAWNKGVIPRVKSQDRIVPIVNHIETHRDSLPTVRRIAYKFADDPRVRITAIDNSFDKGKWKTLSSLDEVPAFDYTKLGDKLYESTREAYQSGDITREHFATAVKGEPKLEQRFLEEPKDTPAKSGGGNKLPPVDQSPPPGLTEPIPQEPALNRRKFINTVKDSENTLPEVAEKVESKYSPITNRETLAEAQEAVKSNYNASIEEVMSQAKPTALSNAKAIVLIDKAQAEGRIADAISLVERTAEKQTELGQAIQALSMYNRLSPEGILMYAQKVVKQAREASVPKGRQTDFDRAIQGLSEADKAKQAEKLGIPHISEILAKELLDMAKKIQEMPEGREKSIQTALMLKKITDQVPRSAGQKIAMVQTISQLLNPKTFARNILGNIGFHLSESLSDGVATALDIAISLQTGKRTVYLPDPKVQGKGLVQGFREGKEEALLGVDMKQGQSKFTLPKNGVFDKGVMGALEKTLRIGLGATDRAFYQAAFNQSIRDQMLSITKEGKAIAEPTPEMIERAHLLGLYRTFQDDNVISKQFVGLKQWLNVNKEFGLGDVILKYPKTPANILARGIEYSPFGFVKSVYELTKPLLGEPFNQEAFVRSTARSMTGTVSLVATGAILGGLGIISGKRSKDPDVTAAREEVGIREYQINASALKRFAMSGFDPEVAALREGDDFISYDWMLPASMGLALGANMVIDPKTNLVDSTMNLAEEMASAAQTLQEQPLVQGVKRFAQTQNVAEAFTNAIQDLPASFVPTLLNQVRQLTDNTARNTRDPDYRKEIYNKAVMRIPGLSSGLPAKITARGQEKEIYQFGTNNPFNVFLNPAFVTKYKPDPVSKMVLDIWEMTGSTVQFPRVASAKIKLGASTSEPIELTPEQYTEFQRYIGNKTDVLFTILAEKENFLNLSDETKAKLLSGFLQDIHTAGKIEVLGYKLENPPKDVLSIIKGIAMDKEELDAVDDDTFGAIEEE